MRFYSKRYCATSGVDEIQLGFEQIKSANIKECQYQVMISNRVFDKTNEQHVFSKVFYNYVYASYVLNFLYIIFHEKSL